MSIERNANEVEEVTLPSGTGEVLTFHAHHPSIFSRKHQNRFLEITALQQSIQSTCFSWYKKRLSGNDTWVSTFGHKSKTNTFYTIYHYPFDAAISLYFLSLKKRIQKG